MPHPTLWDAPTAAELTERIACPVERAAAVTELARGRRTLPADLSQLRRDDLREARKAHQAGALAARLGVSASRISQLVKAA